MISKYFHYMDQCGLCNHQWALHDDHLHKEYGFKIRHLAGGTEEKPIWCYCPQVMPEDNLTYLEYMSKISRLKQVAS